MHFPNNRISGMLAVLHATTRRTPATVRFCEPGQKYGFFVDAYRVGSDPLNRIKIVRHLEMVTHRASLAAIHFRRCAPKRMRSHGVALPD